MRYIKLLKRILFIILIIGCISISTKYTVNATSTLNTVEDTMKGAEDFLSNGKSNSKGVKGDELKEASIRIYNMLFGVGMLISLMVTGILGIKFMLASAEDKATLKEALVPFLVGTIIIFSSFTIWKIAVKLGSNFNVAGGSTTTGGTGGTTTHQSSSGRTHGGSSGSF